MWAGNKSRVLVNNDTTTSTFSPDEQEHNGRRDFNSSVFSVVFPLLSDEVEVEVTQSLVFDDDVNEVNEEGFVIVLEIDDPDITLTEGRDVLVFYISDNDGMDFP